MKIGDHMLKSHDLFLGKCFTFYFVCVCVCVFFSSSEQRIYNFLLFKAIHGVGTESPDFFISDMSNNSIILHQHEMTCILKQGFATLSPGV